MQLNNVNVNVNFLFPIGVVLVILKLAKVSPITEWSWWLVTMPLYVPVVLSLIAFVLFLIIGDGVDD